MNIISTSKNLLIFLLAFVWLFSITFAKQPKVIKPKKFEIGISYNAYNSSSYYNLNDSLITTQYDTFKNYDSTADTTVRYTFDFTRTTLTLDGKYNVNNSMAVGLSLPLSFYKLRERYLSDEYGNRFDRGNFSLTQLDYIEINAVYKFEAAQLFGGLEAKVRIPSRGQNGLYGHTDFLSDGAFEFLAGSYFGAKVNKTNFFTEVLYNYRAEDYKDQFIVNSGIGFTTVPNTELKLFAAMHISASSFDNVRPLNIRETVSQENNYGVGALFKINLTDEFNTTFNYFVTLAGKNTWSYSLFTLYVGYQF